MIYDFIPSFIDKEITLTICRISGSEKDALVDYIATFPGGYTHRLSVTNDGNSKIENANALFEAANWLCDTLIAERILKNG